MTGVGAPADAYRIEPLAKHHDRATFSCGQPSLDDYLRERARKEMANRVAVVLVAVPVDEPNAIAGYYTLSNMTVDAGALPDTFAGKLPRYPILRATLLGRLAVTQQHQGRRLGEHLTMDALSQSLAATAKVASLAVVVDPIDDRARTFYEKYQFIALTDPPSRLFLAMKTIELGLGR